MPLLLHYFPYFRRKYVANKYIQEEKPKNTSWTNRREMSLFPVQARHSQNESLLLRTTRVGKWRKGIVIQPRSKGEEAPRPIDMEYLKRYTEEMLRRRFVNSSGATALQSTHS